ncbi:MAG: T9SS type A sorting domain-containing protein [Saprospiraceae bacterium]|nr:T9SS type A sorting domain-containing protein [Saprospiraceae bacterium]
MKKFYFLFFFLLITSGMVLVAQNRYADPMFSVKKTTNIEYGSNIGILTGAPKAESLLMDLYIPEGDSKTDRPLIMIAHTGSFLPPIYNQQTTGSRSDSTVTYTANYLASRGFVVAAYTYRQGWLPTSPDQNLRTGSLLQAAYRGIQDTRSCIRFFKKSVAENSNPYGIDPSKICVWGVGTGGYLSLGAGSIHDFGEVTLPQFIDQNTTKPFVDSTLLGNIYGTSQGAISIPNHVGYSSNFQLSVNLGGALGDSTWLDGEAVEPAYVGVHCTNDFFAPYYSGPVIVPTTNQFVIFATGTRKAIEQANTNGSNNILKGVNADHDPLKNLITAQKNKVGGIFPSNIPNIINIGTDNFYGFDIPLIFNNQAVPQGSPWDWWDLNTLRAVVDLFNMRDPNLKANADSLHISGLRTNPLMSATRGKTYLDTVFMLTLPRLCTALNLGCTYVNTKDVNDFEVGLKFGPNPMRESMEISTNTAYPMDDIYVYDLKGNLVKAHVEINASQFTMNRNNLHSGFYLAQIRMKDKLVTKQIVVTD